MNPTREILAADIGNTSATIAQMRGLELTAEVDVSSHADADEIAGTLKQKFPANCFELPLVIASVNPRGLQALEVAWQKCGGRKVAVLRRDIDAPIENRAKPPEGAGTDRLMNALAGSHLAGEDCVIVDFGTAITFDVVKQGAYCGGVITPGIGLAMEALHQKTALLPLVDPKGKPDIIGTDTPGAINAGVYYGYIGLVENILREILATYETHPKVFATGGYGAYLAPEIPGIDEVMPSLTHQGIALAWQAASGGN